MQPVAPAHISLVSFLHKGKVFSSKNAGWNAGPKWRINMGQQQKWTLFLPFSSIGWHGHTAKAPAKIFGFLRRGLICSPEAALVEAQTVKDKVNSWDLTWFNYEKRVKSVRFNHEKHLKPIGWGRTQPSAVTGTYTKYFCGHQGWPW